MAMRTPGTFVNTFNGKTVDFDGAYGVQCVDGFKEGCVYIDIPPQPCPNNWAESYWTCKNADGSINQNTKAWQEKYFDLISDFRQFRDGDWVIWPRGCVSHPSSHVAMYYKGQEFGERQYENNRAFCLKDTDFSDASGALRPKTWSAIVIPDYDSDLTINGHLYHLVRQASNLRTVVLSPGLNETAQIKDMDCEYYVYGKITGCNYFQMRDDIKDQPYGTTYGDISSPISAVYQNLPNQDSTMFYDIETGKHGDCTGVTIDPEHNVFSPVLIYEPGKNVQYARMVGLGLCNTVSRYCFVIRFLNGTYALGLAEQDLTPNQIASDFLGIDNLQAVAFIDGGGSAQMMRYRTKERRVEYVRDTGRATAGCIALIGGPVPPQEEIPEQDEQEPTVEPTQPEEPETGENKGEDESMSEPIYEEPAKDPEWKDPEPTGTTILQRISALLSVKSIITLAFVSTYLAMVLQGQEVPSLFENILTMIVSFFFGYQFKKAEKQ